ncbi:MAG: three-Cys-motif partner protein TcmP [Tissierellia bacterium]|jgi:three-Cys-motif partner protein|nr:three-Cys-motif partner protein TcmP [Tissierellia bacterium]
MTKEYDVFFEKPEPQSIIKKEIVTRYFPVWASIMLGAVKKFKKDYRLGYIDLYSGPGIYKNGEESTPVSIMKHILSNKDYRENFVTLFNDCNPNAIESLENNLKILDNYNLLTHKPSFSCAEVDDTTAKQLQSNLIPSFIFLDPFGIKGITIELISKLVKSFGCDIILFFNYNTVQRFLKAEKVSPHMKGLFTEDIFNELIDYLNKISTADKEEVIMTYFKRALKSHNVNFVLPFKFAFEGANRTSHYLIFMTKHPKGAQEIKKIMWSVSSNKTKNIASFEFIPNHEEPTQFNLFDMLNSKIYDLKIDLYNYILSLEKQKFYDIRVSDLYDLYCEEVYTNDNIKNALLSLEEDNKIIVTGRKTTNLKTLPHHCTISIK